METKHYKARIERGITKLIVPHKDGEITFAHPSIGPNTYQNVGAEILNQGYGIPTGNEIASLLHSAYFSELKDKPEFKDIRDISIRDIIIRGITKRRKRWLWVFLQELSTDYGFYSINDLSAQGRSVYGFYSIKDLSAQGRSVDAGKLEKKLSREMKTWRTIKGTGIRVNENNSIRFVEEGSYAIGEVDSKELATDNGMIADYGKEGAEKLAEIVKLQFPNKSYINRLKIERGQAPELRVSLLGDDYGDWLRVDGDNFGNWDGHSFGVLR